MEDEDGLPPVFPHVWNLVFGWNIPPRKVMDSGSGKNGGKAVFSERSRDGDSVDSRDGEAGAKERRMIDVIFESQCEFSVLLSVLGL